MLPVDHLKKVVDWCRERGVLLVSDECYIECVWEGTALSVLHPDVCGGSHEGILAVHSLSKRSNLAGYRCAFAAGDPAVIAELLAVRKNLGLMMPAPQQAAMAAALDDDAHAEEQHARYAARRTTLRAAFERAGFRIDHSEASLYLWATRDEDCWVTVSVARRPGHPGGAGSLLRPRGRAARADRLHRDRRAGGRGGRTAGGALMAEQVGGPRDHLANERTQLAWMRTGATVMVVGLAVARFADDGEISVASLVAGGILVLTGAAGDLLRHPPLPTGGPRPPRGSGHVRRRDRGAHVGGRGPAGRVIAAAVVVLLGT